MLNSNHKYYNSNSNNREVLLIHLIRIKQNKVWINNNSNKCHSNNNNNSKDNQILNSNLLNNNSNKALKIMLRVFKTKYNIKRIYYYKNSNNNNNKIHKIMIEFHNKSNLISDQI